MKERAERQQRAGAEIRAEEDAFRRRAAEKQPGQEAAEIADDRERDCKIPLTVASLAAQRRDDRGNRIGQNRQNGKIAERQNKMQRRGEAVRNEHI